MADAARVQQPASISTRRRGFSGHSASQSRRPRRSTTSRGYDNPLFAIKEQDNNQQVGRAFGNIGLSYDPKEWVSLRLTVGADYVSDERLETLPKTSSSFPTGQVVRGNLVNYQLDNNLTATFTRSFVEGFESRFVLGGNLSSRNFRQDIVTGQDLIAPQPFVLTNTTTRTPNDFRSLVRGESYFAQYQQEFFRQLYLTGTLRNDGFSTFGVSNRRHLFPAATLAWNFANYVTLGGLLSQGRVRAAYGQTGTEPGVYLTNGFYSSGFFVEHVRRRAAGEPGRQRRSLHRIAQAAEQPQAGAPARVRDGHRLRIPARIARTRASRSTIARRATSSSISRCQHPRAIACRRATRVSSATRASRRRSISTRCAARTSTGTSASSTRTTRTRCSSLQGAEAVDLPTGGFFAGTLVSAVRGNPIGVFRSYDFVRCRIRHVELGGRRGHGHARRTSTPLCQAAKAPNGALYVGADGFPVEDQTQRVIGDPNPNWTGGVRTGIRWRKVSVSGLVDIRRGGVIWNGTRGALDNFGTAAKRRLRADCSYDADGNLACTGNERTFGKDFMRGAVFGPGAGTAVPIGENWYTGTGQRLRHRRVAVPRGRQLREAP